MTKATFTTTKNPLSFGSKEVFTERKVNIINAYKMALQLVQSQPNNDWNHKALAWCLIDLIKQNPTAEYIEQLKQIPESAYDEVLEKSIFFALRRSNPLMEKIDQARALSKAGQHRDSANAYFQLLKQQPENQELHLAFGWELWHLSQENLKIQPIQIDKFKRYFFEFFKLNIDKDSDLYHRFLQVALRLIENDKIKAFENIDFAQFCLQWDLNHLKSEDYLPRSYQDAKSEIHEIQPLALSVFREALKNALIHKNNQALQIFCPLISNQFPKIRNSDTLWLKWDLAKSYQFLGEIQKALDLIFPILKMKPNEYWLWDFLGDIYFIHNSEKSVACFCKALMLQKDINFVAKIKLKLVHYFLYHEQFNEARTEIDEIIEYKHSHNQKLTIELQQYQVESWYLSAEKLKNNCSFYQLKETIADELLYKDLPLIEGILGDTYEHNEKVSRKIYIESTNGISQEISLPERRIKLKNKKEGMGVNLKGEIINGKFQLYWIAERKNCQPWDICKISNRTC